MLVVPFLLVLGLRRADDLKEDGPAASAAGAPWSAYSYMPGLMTGGGRVLEHWGGTLPRGRLEGQRADGGPHSL